MSFSTAITRFLREAIVVDSTAVATQNKTGLVIGTTVGLGTLDAGLIGYDTTKANFVARCVGPAGTARSFGGVAPIAAGIVSIAAGSTTGTATIPSGLSITSALVLTSLGGSATTVVASTAVLSTISGTTLTFTITDPAAATTAYVSYMIFTV